MTRMPNFSPESMTDAQRRVYDVVLAGPRGVVRGPVQVWLQNPGLAEHAQALGAYCRFHTTLPPRLSELAIIVTAVHWRAGYEWRSHMPMAVAAGLPQAVADAILAGTPPPFAGEDEAVVHRFATELLDVHAVSQPTWDRAQSVLGTHAVIDLVGVLGYYALISMTIKAFEIGAAPDGDETFGSNTEGGRTGS